jgi:hypothetical protein
MWYWSSTGVYERLALDEKKRKRGDPRAFKTADGILFTYTAIL